MKSKKTLKQLIKMKKKKVCILISAQHPFDVRVFHREAKSLVKKGYLVTIIAQQDINDIVDKIKILGIGKPKNRITRFFMTFKLFKMALKLKADIYHIHNPELLFWGIMLKLLTTKPIIYDVHEHFPDAVEMRYWIPKLIRKPIKVFLNIYENILTRFVSYIITADEETAKKFRNVKNIITLFNFPKLNYFCVSENNDKKKNLIIYVGTIGEDRGGDLMIESIKIVKEKIDDIKLLLFGKIPNPNYKKYLERKIIEYNLGRNIKIFDPIPQEEIVSFIKRAIIGLSLLQNVPKYNKNIPQKVFEYMACGIPVVSSNLKPIRPFILESKCGILVDPNNISEIANAILFLIENPEQGKEMGRNGRKAILEKYNWEKESEKLITLYGDLLKNNH